jgi:GT2 family glycosyltransferase
MNLTNLIDIASFEPLRIEPPNSWCGHLYFAAWIIRTLKPRVFVELGTHSGNSYFSFCQAVKQFDLETKCYSVDTWQGDEQAGFYGEEIFTRLNDYNTLHYSDLSRLLRMTFDEAVELFEDKSINLLHIDGLHTYEAVRHDFEMWLPKLALGAIVLFHDTNVYTQGFGVWKFWSELKERYPLNFEFLHSHGLGVLQIDSASDLNNLDCLESNSTQKELVQRYFTSLGNHQIMLYELDKLKDELKTNLNLCEKHIWQITNLNQALAEREGQINSLNQALDEHDRKNIVLCKQIADRDNQIVDQNNEIVLINQRATDIQNQFNTVISSSSWKLTYPLRKIITIIRQRLNAVQDSVETKGLSMQVDTTSISNNISIPNYNLPLAPADGTWEWSDYYEIQNKIKQCKEKKLQDFTPTPFKLIDIGNETLESASARIRFLPLINQPKVSIIIPVFNNIKITIECLLSIAKYTDTSISYEIIVADDVSVDNTNNILKSLPNIRIIKNETNLGFIRNCNQALKYVKGDFVLFLNNDVQVTKGWLNALLGTFDSQIKVGAVGPRFVYPSGYLQEAGASFRPDGTADMVGLNADPTLACYNYIRRVDYISGACLLMPTPLIKQLGGFSEDYLPCYCEDSDLCLRVQDAGYYVYYNPSSTIIHHLSKTTDALEVGYKLQNIAKNLVTLQKNWYKQLDYSVIPKIIAFYLPQYHPFPENDKWWGKGFTEWSNVTKAHPNFIGHYQPRLPADLGFYDLRINQVMQQQAELAMRYGIHGFCYYYYWFNGKRLLDYPVEQMLTLGKPDMPFCLCWANENWTRRWDGQQNEILMAQSHSDEDDKLVITDLLRFFKDNRYIRIDGHPLILVYRVTLFPNFTETAERWRILCREMGIGEIYIAMVETFDLVNSNRHPSEFGCNASVEFPPQGLTEPKNPSGEIINADYRGSVSDYRDLAIKCATHDEPPYIRFRGVIPSWDNTARRQNEGFSLENATPGGFQAWLEETLEKTRLLNYKEEKLVFINAWNEWAEGAHLEPDRRFGHAYLEAVKNALDTSCLIRKNKFGFED